jgi:hypothetical protein
VKTRAFGGVATVAGGLVLVGLIGAAARAPDWGPWTRGWPGYGRDAQHTSQAARAGMPLTRVRWSTPVDLQPQYWGSALLVHYGCPVVTAANTVVVPVKTGPDDGFRVEGHRGFDGTLLWTMDTDYSLPPHSWVPSCGPTLTPTKSLAVPAAGGTVLVRADANAAASAVTRAVFYGEAQYAADPGVYNANIKINTPITCDAAGNIYFGFVALGGTPAGLQSGLARVTPDGQGTWVSAAAAANDPGVAQVVHNCAPALSPDGSTVYVAVRDGGSGGYLVALDSVTLAMRHRVRPHDPVSGNDSYLLDDGTASPTVGPDGRVFFGVLESPFYSNHLRGWMMQFGADLTPAGVPGAFGWDDTASIVPASAVPLYQGSSPYLLFTKYNNYIEGGGDGGNKIAVLDPGASMVDPISGATVMREVITALGPTPDERFPGTPTAVREWCINTAAVSAAGRCAYANCEDGKLYKLDFTTGTLTQVVTLTAGIGEAYTPTLVGPDGTVYAINNARLYAVGY